MIVPQYGRTLSNAEWSPVIDALLEGQHFVLTTHENSDGDGLGSEVATNGSDVAATFILLGLFAIFVPNLFNSGIFLGFVWVFLAIAVGLSGKKKAMQVL